MTSLFTSREVAAGDLVTELLDMLAGGAPTDAFEALLDDDSRLGAAAGLLPDVKSVVWRAMRVHVHIQRGRSREAGLSALVDAARELAAPHDSMAALLHAITRRARQLLRVDMAYIALLDEERRDSRVHATDGHTSSLSVGLRLPADGIAAADEASGAPFATHNLLADDRVTLSPAFEEMARAEDLRAMIAVPLGDSSRHHRGELYVASRKVRHFTADERSLISSLGILAGLYMETTRLRLAAEARAAELEARVAQVDATTEDLHRHHDLQTALLDLLFAEDDLHAATATGARWLGGNVAVYNADGDLRSAAGEPADVDDTTALAAVPGLRTAEPVMVDRGTWVVPLCRGHEHLGTLVLRGPAELTDRERGRLRLLARTVVLITRRDALVAGSAGDARDRWLDEALGDERRAPDRLAERARRIGLNLDKPYLILVAKPKGELLCRATAWAGTYVQRVGGLRGSRDGHLVLLLPGGDATAAAREVSAALESAVGAPVPVGAAGPLTGAASVHDGYRDAVRCVDTVIALGVAGGAASARDLGFVGALMSRNRDAAGFIEQVIGPVIDYDRERSADLLPTLQAYFEEGGSPTYAAARLHVHTNTVTRRLDRVKELLGPGWQKPDQALEIQLALRLLRVRDLLETRPVTTRTTRVPTGP
ncbi:GAF domain-containing protein [Saccharothrix carnea]|uniref:GAF domain-containing protein n=1 Tax=Saccharothrix carnea TaxID=1280637 RepID=A0A2P8I1B1_SACCR|nr:helix-turn-helix domain-containing protein [Saccharothrix carnea]PSL52252.1 GAF domain-containing protein [Saccharothrix carnea]